METLERPVGARPAPRPQRPRGLDRRPPPDRRSAADDTRRRLVRASLRGTATSGHRADIEGMRAVAVVAVVLYHARLLGFSGGFVGVDVFFVLSGFLITRLLLGELESTGAVQLRGFWARRARRLLPASALVVVVTLFAGRILLPPLSQRTLGEDAIAAGTFTSNFRFANRLGDYFGAQLGAIDPSPLLHFWSLAVEEQFYLCWPLLLLVLARRPRQYRRLLLATVVGLMITGFVVSAWMTVHQPSAAFYLLPARSGELLAGAALAVAGPAFGSVRATWRAAAGWLGLLGILVAFLTYDELMAFPGTATMLPVAATVLVIVAGEGRAVDWAPLSVLRAEPLQWLGRHSYGIYLWHWPIFVLAEAHWGPSSVAGRLALIGIAVALSVVTRQVVEDPVRRSPWLAAAPRRGLALGAALCLLVVALGSWTASAEPRLDGGATAAAPVITVPVADPSPAAFVQTTAAGPTTTAVTTPPAAAPAGAPTQLATPTTLATLANVALPTTTAVAAADPPQGRLAALVQSTQQVLAAASQPAPVPSNLQPSLRDARTRSQIYDDGCVNVGVNAKLQPCRYAIKGSSKLMVLYGDSHAAQWFEAVEAIASEHGYELVVLTKGGCPVATVEVPTPVLKFTCPTWRQRAVAWIAEHKPALVVVANSYTQYPADAAAWTAGAEDAMQQLTAAVSNVLVIGDNPGGGDDPPRCLSDHLDDASACAVARDVAVRADRIAAEVTAARTHRATFVDTTDWFCTPTSCPAVVGNVLVLRDPTHLTSPMVKLMQPLLAAALGPHLP